MKKLLDRLYEFGGWERCVKRAGVRGGEDRRYEDVCDVVSCWTERRFRELGCDE